MNNTDYILKLDNIVKSYKQGKQSLEVLKGIDLTIQKQEIIALVGQSGSGKSTLLQIAGLLDKPTSGCIWAEDKNISKANDEARTLIRQEYVGFVYQYHNLLGDFSALENVMIPMLIAGKNQIDAKKHAEFLLEKLNLSHRLKHRPTELSGGEQQRVAIARALANSPKLLLADEPTGNLDPNTAEDVFTGLLEIIKETGLSALIATHNMELAARMNRQFKLVDGKLKDLNQPLFSRVKDSFY